MEYVGIVMGVIKSVSLIKVPHCHFQGLQNTHLLLTYVWNLLFKIGVSTSLIVHNTKILETCLEIPSSVHLPCCTTPCTLSIRLTLLLSCWFSTAFMLSSLCHVLFSMSCRSSSIHTHFVPCVIVDHVP